VGSLSERSEAPSTHTTQPTPLRASRTTRTRLTIADVCADLGIFRSTFYEWRAKGQAPAASNSPTATFASTAPSMNAGSPPSKRPPNDRHIRRPGVENRAVQRCACTTYKVRWAVAGQRRKKAFRTKAFADSFRSEFVSAQRKGEAFAVKTGLPVSTARREHEMSWFDFARMYVDSKWASLAGNSRRNTAQALATATLALLSTERGRPETTLLRRSLVSWTFNLRARTTMVTPDDISRALDCCRIILNQWAT
jgi:hypothetical protein